MSCRQAPPSRHVSFASKINLLTLVLFSFFRPHLVNAQGGQLDGTFNPGTIGPNQPIEALAVQPDGKILVGGGFTTFNGVVRQCITRLNEDGTPDPTFDPGTGADGVVRCILLRPDGKILIAGDFTHYDGIAVGRIALLEPDGHWASTFNTYTGADGPIYSIAFDPEGRIVVGGDFDNYQGLPRRSVARIHASGEVDPILDADDGADGPVFAVYPFEDENGARIIVGGLFQHFDGWNIHSLVQLNYDGSVCLTYWNNTGLANVTGNERIHTIVRLDDETVLVGGSFPAYAGGPPLNLQRLPIGPNFFGSGLDDIGTGPDGTVRAIAWNQNYQVIIAGDFDNYNGVPRNGIARINHSGLLTSWFATGSGVGGGSPLAMCLQADNKIMIGGGFTQYDGVARPRLARICSYAQLTWYPDLDGDGIGAPGAVINTCGEPAGYATSNTDLCPNVYGTLHSSCDDGDPTTEFDRLDENCECHGAAPVSNFPYEEHFTTGTGGFLPVHFLLNRWTQGTTMGLTDRCAYITRPSVSAEDNNVYSTWDAQEAFIGRKFTFPAAATAIQLGFRWKGMGQAGHDRLKAWLIPSIISPGVWHHNSTPRLDLSGELSGQATWTEASFPIPASYAGQTMTLVFSWASDDSLGTQPPAAIDDITICTTVPIYADADGDGYGALPSVGTSCGNALQGYSTNALDDCPQTAGLKGETCDDGLSASVNDVVGLDCVCRGATLPWVEDFSTGRGGFTALNTGQANQWHWGSAISQNAPNWYISATGGTTFGYANGSPSVSHLIHDFPPIPAAATTITFAFEHFRWNFLSAGRLQVWLVPQSFTPVAGTAITAVGSAPSGRVLLDSYTAGTPAGWTEHLFSLPLSYLGQNVRVVFQWDYDGTATTGNSSTGIDNIALCVITPTSGDADGDGLADCVDECATVAGFSNGDPCDDGNPVTDNDYYQDCVCQGSLAFTEGNLVVLQVGGAGSYDGTGTEMVLKEIYPNGSISTGLDIPSGGADKLIVNGNSGVEGMLSLSEDGTKLAFAGYDQAIFQGAQLATSISTAIPRGIGVMDAGGHFTRRTSSAFFSGASIRSAAVNGTDMWATGSMEGLNYFGADAPVNVASGKANLRCVDIHNGQLYVSSASASGTPAHTGIFAVGSGLPTTGGQVLTTVVNTNSTSTGSFCFNPAGNVLYAALGINGIQKWVNSGTWSLAYTLTFTEGAADLVADFAGANAILYFTTNAGDKVMKVTDPNAGSGSVPVTAVLVRIANEAGSLFRGLSWAPKLACVGGATGLADADGDGVLDCWDICPNLAGLQSGDLCDDGNPSSINDRVTDCVCAGEPAFDPGNIVVLQAGTGAGALAGTGNPIVLRSFTPIGVPDYSMTLPSTGSNAIALSGTSASQGRLTLSSDGTQLVFAGYAQSLPNGTTLFGSQASTIPRAIGTVDAGGLYSLVATSTTSFSGGGISAAASNGVDHWAVGTNQGVRYFGTGTPATVASSTSSYRVIKTFNGQLYASASAGVASARGVVAVGAGYPITAGQSLTMVANTGLIGTDDFVINPASTIMFITIGNTGIQKWVNTGTWGLAYTLTFGGGASSVIADFSGGAPVLYAISDDGLSLLRIADPNSGSGSVPVVPVVLATAPANTAWRGLSFSPQMCTSVVWYADTDGDGFGDPFNSTMHCAPAPLGYVADHTDNCPGVAGNVGSACDDGNMATVNDILSATCTCIGTVPTLSARVLLQGPYDPGTGLMNDALRSVGTFPLTEPYTALGLAPTTGSTTIAPSLLSVTGNDAIVDWVLVELRSPASPTTVVMRRCALLQRDGNVVDLDGFSPVALPGINGPYHVAMRHRNHLGVMSLVPVTIGGEVAGLDLSDAATAVWGTNARVASGTAQLLYMGDCTGNGTIKYTGSGNDRDPILVRVGSTTPNNIVSGYFPEDINLSGQVKYTGSGNDRDPILINVGSTTPNNTRNAQLP